MKENLKIAVARLYYFEDKNQNEIASELKISRSYVSKLLVEARKEKLIEFRSNNIWLMENEKERILKRHFHLDKVVIADDKSSYQQDTYPYTQQLGEKLGSLLNSILKDGDVIGVAWGKTIYDCSRYLRTDKSLKNVKVVQICGGVTQNQKRTYADEISKNFADVYKANVYAMMVPAIVESKQYKEIFFHEQCISQVVKMLDNINVAVFTVGQCSMESSLVKSGFITEKEIKTLISEGAVGEVCTRFINKDGQCVSETLDDRTMAISFQQLQRCDYRIAVILGKQRLEPLKAILHAGYANILLIDEETADVLLEEIKM